ncbi:LysO family transporter [Desulfotruncus alcoholivorax]|uniref:LysO family transporter n=1 Tax=Desulfotruncus alcoholivorax TaxID=265477 RepID=UPI00042312C1|nr:LysO family transporter [Desulfotruncus alcoholivorax]
MALIFISLAAGILIGYFRPLSARGAKVTHTFTMLGLIILLASMGAQLGSNKKILGELGQIGVEAAVLAGCSVAGSVLLVYFARNYIYRDLEQKLSHWQGREDR